MAAVDPSELIEQLQACADAIARNAADGEALLAERNALWTAGNEAGIPAEDLGRPFGLQAQTVRWNLKRDGRSAPKAGQARHRGKREAS